MTAPASRRFDVERALFASQLPPVCRHLLMVIASHINAATGEIPDRNQPSLTRLCRNTGWSRSTVCRRLQDLEDHGWLLRRRPPKWASQRQHVRTKYTVTIPGEDQAAAPDVTSPGRADVPDGNNPLADVVVDAFGKRGKTISGEWAAGLLPDLLKDCRIPGAAENYLRAMIASEQNLARWLPVPTPPRFTATEGFT